jgi:hypothetical protein
MTWFLPIHSRERERERERERIGMVECLKLLCRHRVGGGSRAGRLHQRKGVDRKMKNMRRRMVVVMMMMAAARFSSEGRAAAETLRSRCTLIPRPLCVNAGSRYSCMCVCVRVFACSQWRRHVMKGCCSACIHVGDLGTGWVCVLHDMMTYLWIVCMHILQTMITKRCEICFPCLGVGVSVCMCVMFYIIFNIVIVCVFVSV